MRRSVLGFGLILLAGAMALVRVISDRTEKIFIKTNKTCDRIVGIAIRIGAI